MDNLENILKINYDYFVTEIEPYYFLFYTYNDNAIVVDVHKNNIAHLFGTKKSMNIAISLASASQIYKMLKQGKLKSIFELIDKERFENNTLTLDEYFILQKNIHFVELFTSLINNINLRLYKKKPGDDFDADYLHLMQKDTTAGYIAIIGSENSDYHYFNSILYETQRQNQYKGIAISIKRVVRVRKEDFNPKNIKFIKSKRYKLNTKIKHVKKKVKEIDYKKLKKDINKKLPSQYEIKTGEFSKNSMQLYINKQRVEDHLEQKIKEMTIDEIVKYIIKEYK